MSKFKKILRKIAKQEGVSVKEVYIEMQKAVDAGYYNSDPAIQAAWKKMQFKNRPTPEDIIKYCESAVKKAIYM